jgi:hypothetical protein
MTSFAGSAVRRWTGEKNEGPLFTKVNQYCILNISKEDKRKAGDGQKNGVTRKE